jgi:CBS domain-containing protein
MRIEDVIRNKGDRSVATIEPTATVAELVKVLTEKRIGALVVSADGEHIDGIVSERDVIRGLAELGGAVVDALVSDLMTADVHTAGPDGDVEDVAHSMTIHRIRHMPVLVEGRMVGLVSIGDVVKHRIDQLTEERDHLIGYLQS